MTLDPGQERVDYEVDAADVDLTYTVLAHQPTQDADGRAVCQADGEPFPCRVNKGATRGLVRVMGLG